MNLASNDEVDEAVSEATKTREQRSRVRRCTRAAGTFL